MSEREDYNRLRLGAGLTGYETYQAFDISGGDATAVVNRLVLGDVARLPIGRLLATYMTRTDGGLLADVLIWNQGGRFLLLAEPVGAAALAPWLREQADGAAVRNLEGEAAFIGLDGPFAWEVLKQTLGVKILGVRYLETLADQKLLGVPVDILRAGKTGEYGYILKTPYAEAEGLRAKLLEAGKEFFLAPCGAEALDLCKLENRFTNVNKEGAAAKNVLELNCRIQVSTEKGDYVGREPIEQALTDGVAQRLIGLTMNGAAALPEGSAVTYQGEKIGELVTSGFSWTLNAPVGLALMTSDYAYVGCDYEVSGATATTVSAPFVLNKSIQIRPQEDSFHSVDWGFRP